jgi:2-methylfumaryl-CoA isomerase
MTRNHAPLVAAEDLAGAISGHLAVRAEAPPAPMHDIGAQGGFARDFSTADGERVIVAALTRQQFVDLARTARLGRTFAFLERLLPADFSTCGDLYTHRATIAALLAPWFSRRTVADLAAAFAGTSVPWARLHNLTGRGPGAE